MKKFTTDIISEYLEKMKYDHLPKNVIEKAKICILDSIGCTLGGSITNIGKIVINSPIAKENGLLTIFGHNKKTSLTSAVFINSTLSNILDFDDTYNGHPGATIVPIALNLAEHINASGKDLITAVILAYEISIRIGTALRPLSDERKYIHGHGTWQTFGATTVASKILGLNTVETAHAFAVAGANAPVRSCMKTVYGQTGPTMTKNNYGTASVVGLQSALLASSGFKGPRDIFDGDTGFWRMIGTSYSDLHQTMSTALDKEYIILENTFKPYPCCRLIHSSIDAVLAAVKENDIDWSDIEKISIKTISPLTKPTFSAQQSPENMIKGQFNAPYALTCALRHIEPLDWYKRENMLDMALLEFANRIEFEADPDADQLFKKDHGTMPATAVVHLKSGKDHVKEVVIPRGDPRNPLTLEEFTSKFEGLANKVLDSEHKVMALIDTIMGLEKLENVIELTKHIAL